MKGIFNRRDFLRTVGSSSPFLFPLFYNLRAEAVEAQRKKAVFLHWSNGYTEHYAPKKFGTNFTSSYVLDGLKDHKTDLNILHQLNSRLDPKKNISHTTAMFLTASCGGFKEKPTGPSIDDYLGKTLGTPIASLKLNVDQTRKSSIYNTMSWNKGGIPIAMIKNPAEAYSYVFSGFKFPNSKIENNDIGEPKKILEKKLSIIDYVKSDFDSLKRHLSSAEVSKFESHFDLFRTLEKKIEKDISSLGSQPVANLRCEQVSVPKTSLNLQQRSKLFSDISVAAMACNRTDIVSILMSEGVSSLKYPQLDGRAGIRIFNKSTHHHISHYYKKDSCSDKVTEAYNVSLPTLRKMKAEIDKWYCEEMSYLISRMKEFGIFENSVLLAGNDMGFEGHDSRKNTFVMAGTLGGFFKTNFAKDYRGSYNNNHSAILSAILEGFGQKGAKFGRSGYAQTALKDILAKG